MEDEEVKSYSIGSQSPEHDGKDLVQAYNRGLLTADEFARLHNADITNLKLKLAETSRERDKYKEEAGRDVLLERTLNRRRFMEEFEKTLALADRMDEPYSVLFIDVDQMKILNDALGGHGPANKFLLTLEDAMHADRRKSDLVGRYAGDELIIGLPGTGPKGAVMVAENFSLAYSYLQIERGLVRVPDSNADFSPQVVEDQGQKFFNYLQTLSIGIAYRFSNSRNDPQKLVDFADSAMYDAKEAGKTSRMEDPTPLSRSFISVITGVDSDGKVQTKLIDPNNTRLISDEDFPLAA